MSRRKATTGAAMSDDFKYINNLYRATVTPRDDHDIHEFWWAWRQGRARQHDHLHPVRVAERTLRKTGAERFRLIMGSFSE